MYIGQVFSLSLILSCENQAWITGKNLLKSLNPSATEVINFLGLFFNINTLYKEAGLCVAAAKFTSHNTYRCLVLLVNFDGLVCFRRQQPCTAQIKRHCKYPIFAVQGTRLNNALQPLKVVTSLPVPKMHASVVTCTIIERILFRKPFDYVLIKCVFLVYKTEGLENKVRHEVSMVFARMHLVFFFQLPQKLVRTTKGSNSVVTNSRLSKSCWIFFQFPRKHFYFNNSEMIALQ